jgi:hypothetical protein
VDPQSRESMAEMFKSNKAEALNLLASMAAEAAALKLNKATVRSDSAKIDFGDGKPGSEPKQSFRVVLAKGEWKFAQLAPRTFARGPGARRRHAESGRAPKKNASP